LIEIETGEQAHLGIQIPASAERAYASVMKIAGAVNLYMEVLHTAASDLEAMCSGGDSQACRAKMLLEQAFYRAASDAVLFEDGSYRVALRPFTPHTVFLEAFERVGGHWVRVASVDLGDPVGSARQLLEGGVPLGLARALEDAVNTSAGRAATWAENLVKGVHGELVRASLERGRAADLAAAALENAYASTLENSIACRC